jgi:hypothetical protein
MDDRSRSTVACETGILTAERKKPFALNCEMRSVAVVALIVRVHVPAGQEMACFAELRGGVVHREEIAEGIIMRIVTGAAMDLAISPESDRAGQTLYA